MPGPGESLDALNNMMAAALIEKMQQAKDTPDPDAKGPNVKPLPPERMPPAPYEMAGAMESRLWPYELNENGYMIPVFTEWQFLKYTEYQRTRGLRISSRDEVIIREAS